MRTARLLVLLPLLTLLFSCAQLARITGISVDPSEKAILVGETVQLTATVEGENDPVLAVSWSSSDETIATVDRDGDVTGMASGEVTITATSDFDTTKFAEAAIKVADMLVDLDQQSLELEIDDIAVVTATVRGSLDIRVSWQSSDTTVATVNNAGVVTAVGEGVATITVACVPDPSVTASLEVTVDRPPEPNDTPGTATPIALPYSSAEFEITHNDIDYFVFTLTDAQHILANVNAREFGSPLDATLRLYDEFSLIAESYDHCYSWECTPDPLILAELDPGTYYLSVTSDYYDTSGWYTLNVEDFTGAIPEVDREWLNFQVAEGSTADAVFTLSNTGESDLEFSIANSYSGGTISYAPESGIVPPAGSVEIVVTADATLLTGYDWIYDEAVITTNSPITPEFRLYIEVEVTPTVTVDPQWLYIEVEQGGSAEGSFTLNNASTSDVDYSISTAYPDGFIGFAPESGTVPPAGSVEIVVTVDASELSAGWYYQEAVITVTSTFTRDLWVYIEGQVTAAPDLNEPNDTLQQATPITLDFASPELTITPRDDDYFVFTLAETRTVTADVNASDIGSSLDAMLGLFDEFGNEIETNDDYDSLDPWIERTLDPGTYYLAVTGCCGFGSHSQNGFYFLSVTATP